MIVIDPGHGGTTASGRSTPYGSRAPSGMLEKDFNLGLARQVAARIGRGVVLTRNADTNLSLGDRVALARRWGARTFVSLHANPNSIGRGVDAWIHPSASTASHALARNLLDGIARRGTRIAGVHAADIAVLRPDRLPRGAAACMLEVGMPQQGYGNPHVGLDRIAYGIADALRAIAAPPYDPRSPQDSIAAIERWSADLSEFLLGVPASACAMFPHASICKLYTCRGTTCYQPAGPAPTGFFIAPDRILTAGHVTRGTTSCHVAPGEANNSPANSFDIDDPSCFITHPRYTSGSDWDLGVIKVPSQSVDCFDLGVIEQSVQQGVTVCGYAADISAADLEAWQMSTQVDPNLQHMSAGGSTASDNLETLVYQIQTLPGTSGAPVMYAHDGRLEVVGVHSGGGGSAGNIGSRLTPEKIQWALTC